jgi:S1-C subfamily serine protease
MPDTTTPPAALPPKLLGALSTKLKLAAGSGLVLVVGLVSAPRVQPSALQTPTERPAPLLEQQVSTRIVSEPFRGVAELAARVGTESVIIPARERATAVTRADHARPAAARISGGYGVFVSANELVTDAATVDGRPTLSVTSAAGTTIEAEVVAYEPETTLVLLRTAAPTSPPVTRTPSAPTAGALAVAAARVGGRETIVPVFVTRVDDREFTVTGAPAGLRAGMPIYTLDGTMFAVAGAGEPGRAHAIWPATDRLRAKATAGERLSSLGLEYQAIADDLTRTFGDRGVLINRLVSGGPAAAAGLVPGDVLLALGETALAFDTAASVLSQLPTGEATTARVRRGGREQTLEVMAAPAYAVAALAVATVPSPSIAPLAGSLFPAAVLETAGIPATARVLRLNAIELPSRAEAQRELRRDRRPVLLVEEGDRVFFTTIAAS